MNTIVRVVSLLALFAAAGAAAALEPGTASGHVTVNGEQVALKHAYVFREPKGFYDEADPTWKLVLTAEPVAPRDIDDPFLDPSLRIGLTLTSEFDDKPTLHVLSQDYRIGDFSLSGGADPQMALEQQGPEVFAGRIHLPEPQTFFDDTYQYDLSFNALPVDPNAPIGAALPDGGGEPGAAYLAWTKAIHARDIATLKTLVRPDMAAQLDAPEAAQDLEFLAVMTPTDVRIVEGSSDGSTAILRIEGKMEGEPVKGEVTLERHDERWIPTASSME